MLFAEEKIFSKPKQTLCNMMCITGRRRFKRMHIIVMYVLLHESKNKNNVECLRRRNKPMCREMRK